MVYVFKLKKTITFVFAIFLFSFSYGQEVCNNGVDDDSDGLIDLNDTAECVCTPSVGVPTSLIPNPSFEAMDCCPSTYSQLNCATGWVQASDATSDYFNTCGYQFPGAIAAGIGPPDGGGYVGAIVSDGYLEYIGSCLTSPMVAGTSYTIQMQMASYPIDPVGGPCGTIYYPPLDITMFGAPSCSSLPFTGYGCPPAPWSVLGSVTYVPSPTWGTVTLTFTPSININTIIIGASCAPLDPAYSGSSCYPYFYFDNILVNESSMFSSSISQSGADCSNDMVLTGTTSPTATYQWYQNGVAIAGQTSSTLNVSTGGFPEGYYSLVTTDSGFCSVAGDSVLFAASNPVIAPAGPFCPDALPFNLSASSTGGTWSGPGITSGSAGTFDPATAGPGIYPIIYTEPCGGGADGGADTINIEVYSSSWVGNSSWTNPGTMCASAAPVNLNSFVTGTPGGTWSGTGVSGSTFDPAGLSGPISITYITGTAPCDDTVTHVINVLTVADPTITAVGPFCSDASSITLTAVSPGGTWTGTGVINPSTGAFNPAAATIGTNLITYTIPGACGGTDTVIITVNQTGNAAWTLQSSICDDDPSINLNSLVTGTPGGTWSGPGVTGSTFDPSGLSGSTTITYSEGTPPCEDVQSFSINVSVIDASFTATPTNGLAPLSVVFNNTSTNATSYIWTYGNGISSTAIDSSLVYEDYGVYVVTLIATNSAGCTDTAAVTIIADAISSMIVPNIFSPNGDIHNNEFMVNAIAITTFHCEIYDRWGLKMYEWDDVNRGWAGLAKNGSPAPDGTYYYMISATGFDGKDYQLKGFLSLVR